MTPEEFEPIVRAKIKERIDQGWIVMREIVRDRLEVGGVETECACALGCFVEDSSAGLNDAVVAAGLSGCDNAAWNFIDGFDGTAAVHSDDYDPAWQALGCRMWDYAQELTRRRAAQEFMAQRDAEKEST